MLTDLERKWGPQTPLVFFLCPLKQQHRVCESYILKEGITKHENTSRLCNTIYCLPGGGGGESVSDGCLERRREKPFVCFGISYNKYTKLELHAVIKGEDHWLLKGICL